MIIVRSWIVHLTSILCSLFHFCPNLARLCVVSAFVLVKVCDLAHHLEACASIGSAEHSVMGRTKWPANYTRYFALGMQLPLGVWLC